jgi:hypothetical protein
MIDADFFGERMTDKAISRQKRLPDPEICRTRYLRQPFGFTDYLVENPNGCEYLVRSAAGVHCYHPDRRSFEKAGKP